VKEKRMDAWMERGKISKKKGRIKMISKIASVSKLFLIRFPRFPLPFSL